jgi:hypothetical protein
MYFTCWFCEMQLPVGSDAAAQPGALNEMLVARGWTETIDVPLALWLAS